MKIRLRYYLLRLIFILFILAVLGYVFSPRPELKTFTTYSTAIFDRSGELLKLTLAQDDRYRLYQRLDQISPDFIQATLVYEDKKFYQHFGVDFPALINAFWSTYILSGRRVGASTITMQVARLRWNMNTTNISGKLKQIFRAIQLSRHYSKQQILEAYFNMASYGGNIEGIGAASLIYFNKQPNQLSLPEALTLAVIPQNPNKRNPVSEKGYKTLLVARENLFQRWVSSFPKDRVKQKYFQLPLSIRAAKNLPKIAPHFTQFLLNRKSAWSHGNINSTLDKVQQIKLEKIIKDYISSKSIIGINNASAVLLNYETMEVEAMVGSADFYNDKLFGQVNGTTAKRSPGSTLKPFVYALAIDEGLIHPMSLLKDSPIRYGGFTPENYDKQFVGPILAKDALLRSRNVPAVTLQSRLKQLSFYDFLVNAGVSGLKSKDFYGLALALGGAELTMMELIRLYSVLANQGILREIITQKNNPQIFDAQPKQGKKILSAEASFLLLDMLKDNPAPDALDINMNYLAKNDIAWKTGTSWAYRDAWAIGISGSYVLAVWIGNFNGKGNNAFVGRTATGPLLFSAFDALVENKNWTVDKVFRSKNLNLKKIEVCANTGDLYEKYCPSLELAWFIPGISPIKASNIYRSISINKATGLRACYNRPGETENKVFEFWPSDFLRIFNQAGILLKTPPKYDPKCDLNQKSNSGQSPVIRSPQSQIEYVIRSEVVDGNYIPFSATVDSDVESLFWFVNGKFVGSAKQGTAFIWHASNGKHSVRVVDDSGRAASKVISVIQIR